MAKPKAAGVIKPARKNPTAGKFPAGKKTGASKGKTTKPGQNFAKPDLAEEATHGYKGSKNTGGGKPNQNSWKISKKKSAKR